MPRDWEKSRAQLLLELRRIRKERDRLATTGGRLPGVESGDASRSRLDTLYQVIARFAGAGSLARLTPDLLRELAQGLGWDAGILWMTRDPDGVLHAVGSWNAPDTQFEELDSLSRQTTFLPGRGPMGHAWGNSTQPALHDVTLDGRSPRAHYSAKAGLHWALHFPIWHEGSLLGFFEFFGSEPVAPESENNRLLAAAGQLVVQRHLREHTAPQSQRPETPPGPPVDFAVIDLDARGCVLRWSKDAERMQGFPSHEVIGKHVSLFYPEAEEERAVANLASAASRGFAKDGGWRVRRGQQKFWADVIILPKRAPHGEITGYTKVVHGVTLAEDLT